MYIITDIITEMALSLHLTIILVVDIVWVNSIAGKSFAWPNILSTLYQHSLGWQLEPVCRAPTYLWWQTHWCSAHHPHSAASLTVPVFCPSVLRVPEPHWVPCSLPSRHHHDSSSVPSSFALRLVKKQALLMHPPHSPLSCALHTAQSHNHTFTLADLGPPCLPTC